MGRNGGAIASSCVPFANTGRRLRVPTIEFHLDADRAREALAYLASKSPGLDVYRACKLLFLADKYHLVRYGRTITGDRYYAMPHGPAPNRVLNLLNIFLEDPSTTWLSSVLTIDRSFRYPHLVANGPLELDNLSQSDIKALDVTLERFGSKTFDELKSLTHEMVAYRNAWDKRGRKKSVPMDFEDFFEEDSDAIAGVLEQAIEESQFRKAFPGPRI